MEFKLPLPTLKSLSSLRICQQWANHDLGPFQHVPPTEYFEMIRLRERQSHLSIDGLPIPHSLKAIVGDVLFGILYQWSCCIGPYPFNCLAEEVKFGHFDAFGRLDVKRSLTPVLRKKVAEENDLSSLHALLTEAYNFWLLPEVDVIFRKMVAMASNGSRRRSEILMEGPRLELRHGKCHLVYRFVEKDAAESLKTIPYAKCLVTIILERESIVIAPCSETRFCNFDSFKDHFHLFEPSEREAFIKDVLSHDSIDIKDQLDIYTFLKQKNDQRNWMLEGLALTYVDFDTFLEMLLIWPFTSFFIDAFKHLAPHLEFDDYCTIFSYIVMAMPAEQQYGVLHRNLLVYYWSILTANVKRKCATGHLNWAMGQLKVKAPFLHDAIKTELDSLVTATDEGQLPKRMRLG